jgi:hypothetical protein
MTSAPSELSEMSHGAAFLVGLLFGVVVVMRVLKMIRAEFQQEDNDKKEG